MSYYFLDQFTIMRTWRVEEVAHNCGTHKVFFHEQFSMFNLIIHFTFTLFLAS